MTVNNELVSVIIPTSNRSELVVKAIASVWEQTWRPIEVIVVNDCSTDDTKAVLDALQSDKLRVIHNDRPRGGAVARNQGIEAARGHYIAFLDDDDTWVPEKTSLQVAALKQDANLSVVTCSYFSVTPDGRRKTVRIHFDPQQLLLDNYLGGASNYLTTKDNLLRINKFNPTLRSGQDWDLLIRLNTIGQIGIVDVPLVHYLEHNSVRISNPVSSYLGRRDIFLDYRHQMTAQQRYMFLAELMLYRGRLNPGGGLRHMARILALGKKVPPYFLLRQLARCIKFYFRP